MQSGTVCVDAPRNARRETTPVGVGHVPRRTGRRDRTAMEQGPAGNASDGGGFIAHTMPGGAGGREKPSSAPKRVTLILIVALQGPTSSSRRRRTASARSPWNAGQGRSQSPRSRTRSSTALSVHNACRIELKGESRRKRNRPPPCPCIDRGGFCGIVDEPFGPARALRDVWTSRGRGGWRLAHRVDHTRGLLAHRHHRTTTIPILSLFGFLRPDGRRDGGACGAGAARTDHGHRVHRGVEIREGLVGARSGLACGQPAGIKKEDRTQASVRVRLARWRANRSVRCRQESPSNT